MRAGVAILSIVLLCGCSGPQGVASEPTIAEAETAPEAAAQLVRTYYRLVESGRLSEAAALREDGLTEDVAPFLSLKAEVAGPRRLEAAAGSVYVMVPVALTGRFVTGGEYRAGGRAILRRSSDEGASRAERRWRIHRLQILPSGSPPTG